MEEQKRALIEQAMDTHGTIRPCGPYKELNDCFTIYDNHLFFWFNTPEEETTKILSTRLDN